MQLPHFCPCLYNYYMGTKDRYTYLICNPCLCNSHISDCVFATTTWEQILDILDSCLLDCWNFWQLLSSHDTSDLSDNRESHDATEASVRLRRPNVTGRKLQAFEHFTLVWTCSKFHLDILVWLIIHAHTSPTFLTVFPTFLTVFMQLLHGNQR